MASFAFTLFLSAFLLFGVQPLAGKFALPWFGGTPAVWTACMLFFQVALLAGYSYAHASATRLSLGRQARLHLALLAVAVAVLAGRAWLTGSPVAPGPEWRPTGESFSVLRLLAMLATTIGLPFFLLSTTGPLLQSWLSRLRPGTSPYRLYALSNAGSLLSLLGYPFLVEPRVTRTAQAWGFSAGFLLFAVACAVCAVSVLRRADAPAAVAPQAVDGDAARPGVGRTLAWLGLSACASILLLATTNQLSQDVAAGPFLWVLPLALYLLTFILAFEREALYHRGFFVVLLILSVAGVTRAFFEGALLSLSLQVAAYAGALFAGCMVCHGELFRLRPAPRHLSSFYLWVSMGGAAGGVFVSLVAPGLFHSYAEYPLSLLACCAIAIAVMVSRPAGESRAAKAGRLVRILLLSFVTLSFGVAVSESARHLKVSARNFFGVVRVFEQDPTDPKKHLFVLRHGVITHGYQYAEPALRGRPTSYFTADSGLGLAIAEQRRLKEVAGQPPGLRLGVLGLGVGTSSALAQAGDSVRFYEINPQVIALARGEGGYFSYLRDTPAHVEVVEGDARISLERELERGEPQGFDVLALDVFSSDAIPVHLLTEEAVATYRKHLAPHGVLAMHISNRHLDLLPIALAHARAFGMYATQVLTGEHGDALPNVWVLLSPDKDFTLGATFQPERERLQRIMLRVPPKVTWTDEKSSVLPVLRERDEPPKASTPAKQPAAPGSH